MAAPSTQNMLRIPGKLVKDPTDLSAAYPYGGTELGLVHQAMFKPQAKHHPITAEEWGEQTVEVISGGTSVLFGVTLRGMDNDAWSSVWPDTATGSPSGDKTIRFRVDNSRAGSLLSASSMILLFVPEAVMRHRAVIIRDAIPVVVEDASIQFSASEEIALDVIFYGRPDSSERVAQIGYIKDLAL